MYGQNGAQTSGRNPRSDNVRGRAGQCPGFQTLFSRVRLCLTGGLWKCNFYPKFASIFPTLILEL
jgi:hypothetical protein